jgi:hypothetical protein
LLRVESEEKKNEVIDPRLASSEPFQFNYLESLSATEQRFADWLNETVSIGLAEWHKVIARETNQ